VRNRTPRKEGEFWYSRLPIQFPCTSNSLHHFLFYLLYCLSSLFPTPNGFPLILLSLLPPFSPMAAATSRSFPTHAQLHFDLSPTTLRISTRVAVPPTRWPPTTVSCSCSDSAVPIRRTPASRNGVDKVPRRQRIRACPALPFASSQSRRFISKQGKFYRRCTPRNSGPQSRDTPPKRDTGIANEKDWGIDLVNEIVNESGTNEDGSTWYREGGEDIGEKGYRCRWTTMGGKSHDGSSQWKETWWEKSDWTGYKELGVEKSGKNAEGDSWWETWQEVLHQDEWRSFFF
ncbi:hypothetical protein LINGRAHAP2_LOCUS9934, partial [Linum grandiflorum]